MEFINIKSLFGGISIRIFIFSHHRTNKSKLRVHGGALLGGRFLEQEITNVYTVVKM